MATHASADKAARQSQKRRIQNVRTVSLVKSSVKKLRTALATKFDSKDSAKKTLVPLLDEVQKVLTKAASKNVIKRGNASRKVSRLSIQVQKHL